MDYQDLIQENYQIDHNDSQLKYDTDAWKYYTQPNIENILKVSSEFPNKGVALDIGSAYGTMSAFLSTLGWKVITFDNTDKYISKNFIKKYGVEFRKEDILKANLPKCDLIVFTEVLEHLCGDIQSLFNKFYESLNDGGYLVLSTPHKDLYKFPQEANVLSYKDLTHFLEKDKEPIGAHYYHYLPEEIQELVSNAKLTIKDFKIITSWQYYIIQKNQPVS